MTKVAPSVLHSIGSTPIVRLRRVVPPIAARVLAAIFSAITSLLSGQRITRTAS